MYQGTNVTHVVWLLFPSPVQTYSFPFGLVLYNFPLTYQLPYICMVPVWYLLCKFPESRHTVFHIYLSQHLLHNEDPQKYLHGKTLMCYLR